MNQKFILNLRELPVGGAVTSGSLYSVGDYSQMEKLEFSLKQEYDLQEFTRMTMSRNRLLILLHGYNNPQREGIEKLTRYMDLLAAGGFGDVMIAVLWPGDGWAKALSFPAEARDADDSAASLHRWIDIHVDRTASISFIAHSLGCRVAMRAAGLLATNSRGPRLGRICLMAAAINNDSLGSTYEKPSYRTATLAAERVAVLSSGQDTVLSGAYPLGEVPWTALRGEDWGLALGYTGPKEHDAEVLAKINPLKADSSHGVNHSDYLGLAPKEKGKPEHTTSWSEVFALQFFKPVDKPEWPSTKPNQTAAPAIDPVRP
jgi:pimeloyl-ACP methyl ester carboxylesterase